MNVYIYISIYPYIYIYLPLSTHVTRLVSALQAPEAFPYFTSNSG